MEMNRFEVADLENAIRNLKAAFPELAEDDDLFADVLEGETTLHETLGKLVDMAREQKAMQTAVDEMIIALNARGDLWQKRETATRALILKLMNIAAQRKVVLPQATIAIANGRKGVVITDEEALPPEAFVMRRFVSRTQIKDLLEAGKEVPGAALTNGAETLVLR